MSEAAKRAAALEPGTGQASLLAYATKERAGAALEVESKLRSGLTAFAQAWAGAARGERWRADYGAVGGVALKW